jgi:hypothetical protein
MVMKIKAERQFEGTTTVEVFQDNSVFRGALC